MKIQVFFIGKPRDRALNAAAAEYAKRLGRSCRFEMREIKSAKDAATVGKPLRIALDPAGEALDSDAFARLIESAGRDIAFFVGGPEGFSKEFPASTDRVISLSKMVLPHELARLVLVEQIYRAFMILSGHPYPR